MVAEAGWVGGWLVSVDFTSRGGEGVPRLEVSKVVGKKEVVTGWECHADLICALSGVGPVCTVRALRTTYGVPYHMRPDAPTGAAPVGCTLHCSRGPDHASLFRPGSHRSPGPGVRSQDTVHSVSITTYYGN
jgi:hypothetical protein